MPHSRACSALRRGNVGIDRRRGRRRDLAACQQEAVQILQRAVRPVALAAAPGLEALAEKVDARGFDLVHYSTLLSRITRALSLEGCHVAMLVDKDGYMKDLPDNMPGTLIYGQAQEIRGTVVFVLEDDKNYTLLPMKGLQRVYMFTQLLNAATGGLVRLPSSEELESIGAEDPGGLRSTTILTRNSTTPTFLTAMSRSRKLRRTW